MELYLWDILAFVLFLFAVVAVSLYAARKEDTNEDYFLAGRRLGWTIIGFSLIASNISTEHFVGMAGRGFGEAGLAIASYEWIAAVTLVVVAIFLLPLFLRLGIFTMPEFLEHRYGLAARQIMALYMMAAYVGVAITAVLYSGAIGLRTLFDINFYTAVWLIGLIAGAYTIYGGLKAVVWSDLLQGATLLIGGAIVLVLGLQAVGGLGEFLEANQDKLHMAMPGEAFTADGRPMRPELPWTALLLGIWIPNFFYWGFNQFITQRTLGARSVRQGQLGIVMAAFIKLLIPFIIIFPGIIAYQLYRDQIADGDQAYAVLVRELVPIGLRGVMFAALFGAIMSSLDSMLNAAASIFTNDFYKRLIRPDSPPRHLVGVGRIVTGVLVVIGCLMAPLPGLFEGVFNYIQMVWGFVSPGVVAVFVVGLILRRAPAYSAVVALVASPILYGLFLWIFPYMAFLNCMALTFIVISAAMVIITLVHPLPEPVYFEARTTMDLSTSRLATVLGIGVVVITVVLYAYFW